MTSIKKTNISNKDEHYSEEEVSNYLKNNIRISAIELKKEILEKEEKLVGKFKYSKKELSYV